jgi:tetratricopeptide (TPR) repeat protein
MKNLLFALCLAFAAVGPAYADDSPKAVQAAIAQGNYPLAEQELRQAIAEHPQSAKAHYVLAQVLAHQGNIGEARAEADKAQGLDPKIGFTEPAKFQRFQAELRQATAPAPSRAAPARREASGATASPVPFQVEKPHTSIWPWVLGLVVIGGIVMMVMRRRQSLPPGGPGYGYGQGPNANVPPGFPGQGYPPQNQGSGIGGSFLGGLAGGALGAAAVNMYENHERREEGERTGDANGSLAGGVDAGDSRGQAYDELRDQPIDMGNDDSGWGGGGGGDDSGFDSGGGDDSWT